MTVYLILLEIFCFSFAFLLRILPCISSKNIGVDNWYWLLYIENLKVKKEFPPKMNYYILEIDEQWYPPLYPLILSLFSKKFLNKYYYLIAPITDCLSLILACSAIYYITGNVILTLIAGIIYAINPFAINYNTQLNPRGLGVLITAVVFLFDYKYEITGDLKYYFYMLLVGTVVLFLHKMSTQMMWFYLIIKTILEVNIYYFISIPVMIVLALLVSKGFYWKVLMAHFDIVSFWHRNIKKLNAHQYYESVIYRKKDFKSTALYQPGIKNKLKIIQRAFAYNPFVLIIPLVIMNFDNLSTFGIFSLKWVSIVYLWFALTSFVPFFKSFGAGLLYIYHGIIPTIILTCATINDRVIYPINMVVLMLSFLLSIYAIINIYKKYKENSNKDKNNDLLENALKFLKSLPDGIIYCIPFYLPDITAYYTRKRVFWGGHGYGFKMLEPFFPVMKVSIESVFKEYNITYVLFDKKYLNSIYDIITNASILLSIYENSRYVIYKIKKDD